MKERLAARKSKKMNKDKPAAPSSGEANNNTLDLSNI
jgi:hypothetical protein